MRFLAAAYFSTLAHWLVTNYFSCLKCGTSRPFRSPGLFIAWACPPPLFLSSGKWSRMWTARLLMLAAESRVNGGWDYCTTIYLFYVTFTRIQSFTPRARIEFHLYCVNL